MANLSKRYEALLAQVDKPGRYLGNEKGAVRKDLSSVRLRFALAFPEVYEIAQSHPGLQMLYDLLNRRDDVYAERAYAPWFDFEALLRQHSLPLASLETCTPLSDFDIVGFSLQYELTYTNLLCMLDLGGIPLRAADRSARDPLIIAGGPCAFNPEPLADFLDAVLLGDGEQAVADICDATLAWDGSDRAELLERLSRVEGVYIPAFYRPNHSADGRLRSVLPVRDDIPAVVEKRILLDLDSVPSPQTHVVPNLKVVHGRPSLEVMRGCVKGCRFCQAGYIYRPLRERDPRRVLQQAEETLAATGAQELSLLSLSTGDYSCVNPVITELMNRYSAQRVAVSLPSTRVDALAPSLLEQIRRVRKTGFTLAPEAGSQRLRDIIQKEYTEDELIEAARQIFGLGWRSIKLYFMLGLPGETEEDLRGIADLAARVAAVGGRGREVTASVSTFVPKPHTPFQWAAQVDIAETQARQKLLRAELSRRRVRFKWHDARTSYLEGVISRGDRRVGALLLRAYELGCRFDGWTEHCRFELWEEAMRDTDIDPTQYLRRRFLNEALPWDHISSGVTKAFLQRELAHAVEGRLTPDCSIDRCTYCGACDFERVRNVTYHLAGARGSEHRGEVIDNWAQTIVDADGADGSWEPRGWQKQQAKSSSHGTENAAGIAAAPAPDPAVAAADGLPATNPSPGLGNAEEWLAASSESLAAPVSAPPAQCRLRLTYAKLDAARFISHLEIIDVFAAACRRARLPLAFTSGFRPLPRMRFSPGLPVGAESHCEVIDIDLTEARDATHVQSILNQQLPDGLRITAACEIDLRAKSPDRDLTGFLYRIDISDAIAARGSAWVDERFAAFLAAPTYPFLKRNGKGEREVDARPFVDRLERIDGSVVEIDVRFSDNGSIKPSELLAVLLELEPKRTRGWPMRKVRAFYRIADTDDLDTSAAVEVAVVEAIP